jgi:2-aminoadipate transaminase
MFIWVRLPAGCDAMALLPQAVAAGVAYVPGEAFFAGAPDTRTLRLSFVTLSPENIRRAVAALGGMLRRHLDTAAELGRPTAAATSLHSDLLEAAP